ncbi:MAG: hypothetical protein J0M12_10475, partial [Deltaproteobacteria bacterium]|nr:hypothetical protein [Deltaproteobacteria bacterium]
KIFTYHFHEAIRDKVIRNIKITNVSPDEMQLSFSDEQGKKYSLADILKLKEEAWFSRGVAMSEDCCGSIARKAKEMLEELKEKFPATSHQIIASAISVRHAREFVKPAFEKLGLNVGLVSSAPEDMGRNEQTFKDLLQEKIQVIVHVGMLGEGFDHIKLGVAAIFRPYKSLNPYIQFVGRVIRNNPPTKYCYVVSHLGLNQSERFEEFRLYDNDDQEFIQSLLFQSEPLKGNEDQSFVELDEDDLSTPDGSNSDVKITEVGTDLLSFDSDYVKEDETIEQLRQQISKLSDAARTKLLGGYNLNADTVSVGKKGRLKPVDERNAAKNLLHEKAKSIATDIISALRLKAYGRNFNPMATNFGWVVKKVSKSINDGLGIKSGKRKDLSNSELRSIDERKILETAKAQCTEYFRAKLAERASAKNDKKSRTKGVTAKKGRK